MSSVKCTISQTAKVNEPHAQQPIGSQTTHPLCARPVLVTPIRAPYLSFGLPPADALPLDKVILKAVGKTGKTTKFFTLRNIVSKAVISRDNLVGVIREQLQGDITARDFDVGVIGDKGSVISIRTNADLVEVWFDLRRGKNIKLW